MAPVRRLLSSLVGKVHRTPEISTLREVERQHICAVLAACKGVIEGPRGAARILGLPASTVRYRIRKLGIAPAGRQLHITRITFGTTSGLFAPI